MKWHVRIADDAQIQGPYFAAELRERLASGAVARDAKFSSDGGTTWRPTPPPIPDAVAALAFQLLGTTFLWLRRDRRQTDAGDAAMDAAF